MKLSKKFMRYLICLAFHPQNLKDVCDLVSRTSVYYTQYSSIQSGAVLWQHALRLSFGAQ